jgi:hypothetical protein
MDCPDVCLEALWLQEWERVLEDCHKRSCWKNPIGMSAPGPYRSDPDDGGNTHLWNVGRHLRTPKYIPEDSELHTRRTDNLKSHKSWCFLKNVCESDGAKIVFQNRTSAQIKWAIAADILRFFKSLKRSDMLSLRSEDAFVIGLTCVANFMEVKVLYVQQDLRYEISSYWRFNV